MPATQISFLAFAQAAQQQATVCAPPVTQAASVLVAQPVAADGGECPPFLGSWARPRLLSPLRDDAYVAGFVVDWACGGLDAPRDPPVGCHVSLELGGLVYADGYLCRHAL